MKHPTFDATRQALIDAWPVARSMGVEVSAALIQATMREFKLNLERDYEEAFGRPMHGDAIDVEFRVVEAEQLPDGVKLLTGGKA